MRVAARRGSSAPVARPNGQDGQRSLRDMLEATADEVGL